MNNNVLIEFIGHNDLFFSLQKVLNDLNYNVYSVDFNDTSYKQFNYSKDTNLADHHVYQIEDCNVSYLTLEQYKSKNFKFIISTNKENREFFFKLHQLHKDSIYINQILNVMEYPEYTKNAMMGFYKSFYEEGNNVLSFIPEHRDYFKPNFSCKKENTVIACESYVHKGIPITMKYLNNFKNNLTNYNFEVFIPNIKNKDLPEFFSTKKFVLHPKNNDGFFIREAMCCGLIPIMDSRMFDSTCDNKGNCMQHMLQYAYCKDKVNYIDLNPDKRPWEETYEILREYGDNFIQKSKEAYEYTREHMNFDVERSKIKNWLDKL